MENAANQSSIGEDLSVHSEKELRELEGRYLGLLDEYVGYAREAGYDIVDHREDEIFFRSLPTELKVSVCDQLQIVIHVCEEMIEAGESIADERKLIWRVISKFGWRPPSQMFSLFHDDDIIEIYDLQTQMQIFRNFRFLEFCSYTLDELLCRPYYALFHRNEKDSIKIQETVQKLVTTDASIVHYDMQPHVITELSSSNKYQWLVDSRFLAPLFDDANRKVGALNLARGLMRLDRDESLPAARGDSPQPKSMK